MDIALHRLIDHIQTAAAQRTPLRIRGGGSKDFYGETLQGELLDTTPYRGIVSYEPSELVVTMRAGTPLAELEAALTEKGQCLAFEPPRFGPANGTCGGMVAAGLSGPARASVGGVRDYVLGVQLVNGLGEHLTFGGQVMKNVAGYDVSRLMVGALGTLGLLTEISLKVLPVAPAEATLVFELDQASALAQLQRWGAQPLPLNASCWVHDDTAANAPELLFLRLRGAVAAVESACTKLLKDVPGHRMDIAQAGPDWTACRDLKLPFFTAPANAPEPLALWRLSVPQTAPALDLPWPQLVEWHGGQRWLRAPVSAMEQLRQAATAAGGSASVFMACGSTGVNNRFSPLQPTLEQIHRRLKAEFDPAGILNPGRMYPLL
ncbi:glycolate oxidase subunit GlcE [Rhodoferax sp.]|uniref:glycolate oxidase subunit GlcE n=1 Tax=Rhodoferax sp. TaxID=50421 RepID=UPI00260F0FCB|nr:glycolate oxidase subunit GlcE [Rhodoferax sp.]MDD2919961.1 glycolate oxidase subunit GlcE [Rhodoferax sp.]